MAKQTKLDRNTPEIDAFKSNRFCYNDNGIIWSTYCKVTCEYNGTAIDETMIVRIRWYGGKYENLELHGFEMIEGEINTVFSAGQATFRYEDETLVIHGTRNGKYYKITIGVYDADFVAKYAD